MGTIGHSTLLHELKNWQIRAALRGYYRQQRTAWETARFTAFVSACAFGGDGKLKTPHDLLSLPWDKKEEGKILSDEEIESLQRLIDEENERLAEEAPRRASENET